MARPSPLPDRMAFMVGDLATADGVETTNQQLIVLRTAIDHGQLTDESVDASVDPTLRHEHFQRYVRTTDPMRAYGDDAFVIFAPFDAVPQMRFRVPLGYGLRADHLRSYRRDVLAAGEGLPPTGWLLLDRQLKKIDYPGSARPGRRLTRRERYRSAYWSYVNGLLARNFDGSRRVAVRVYLQIQYLVTDPGWRAAELAYYRELASPGAPPPVPPPGAPPLVPPPGEQPDEQPPPLMGPEQPEGAGADIDFPIDPDGDPVAPGHDGIHLVAVQTYVTVQPVPRPVSPVPQIDWAAFGGGGGGGGGGLIIPPDLVVPADVPVALANPFIYQIIYRQVLTVIDIPAERVNVLAQLLALYLAHTRTEPQRDNEFNTHLRTWLAYHRQFVTATVTTRGDDTLGLLAPHLWLSQAMVLAGYPIAATTTTNPFDSMDVSRDRVPIHLYVATAHPCFLRYVTIAGVDTQPRALRTGPLTVAEMAQGRWIDPIGPSLANERGAVASVPGFDYVLFDLQYVYNYVNGQRDQLGDLQTVEKFAPAKRPPGRVPILYVDGYHLVRWFLYEFMRRQSIVRHREAGGVETMGHRRLARSPSGTRDQLNVLNLPQMDVLNRQIALGQWSQVTSNTIYVVGSYRLSDPHVGWQRLREVRESTVRFYPTPSAAAASSSSSRPIPDGQEATIQRLASLYPRQTPARHLPGPVTRTRARGRERALAERLATDDSRESRDAESSATATANPHRLSKAAWKLQAYLYGGRDRPLQPRRADAPTAADQYLRTHLHWTNFDQYLDGGGVPRITPPQDYLNPVIRPSWQTLGFEDLREPVHEEIVRRFARYADPNSGYVDDQHPYRQLRAQYIDEPFVAADGSQRDRRLATLTYVYDVVYPESISYRRAYRQGLAASIPYLQRVYDIFNRLRTEGTARESLPGYVDHQVLCRRRRAPLTIGPGDYETTDESPQTIAYYLHRAKSVMQAALGLYPAPDLHGRSRDFFSHWFKPRQAGDDLHPCQYLNVQVDTVSMRQSTPLSAGQKSAPGLSAAQRTKRLVLAHPDDWEEVLGQRHLVPMRGSSTGDRGYPWQVGTDRDSIHRDYTQLLADLVPGRNARDAVTPIADFDDWVQRYEQRVYEFVSTRSRNDAEVTRVRQTFIGPPVLTVKVARIRVRVTDTRIQNLRPASPRTRMPALPRQPSRRRRRRTPSPAPPLVLEVDHELMTPRSTPDNRLLDSIGQPTPVHPPQTPQAQWKEWRPDDPIDVSGSEPTFITSRSSPQVSFVSPYLLSYRSWQRMWTQYFRSDAPDDDLHHPGRLLVDYLLRHNVTSFLVPYDPEAPMYTCHLTDRLDLEPVDYEPEPEHRNYRVMDRLTFQSLEADLRKYFVVSSDPTGTQDIVALRLDRRDFDRYSQRLPTLDQRGAFLGRNIADLAKTKDPTPISLKVRRYRLIGKTPDELRALGRAVRAKAHSDVRDMHATGIERIYVPVTTGSVLNFYPRPTHPGFREHLDLPIVSLSSFGSRAITYARDQGVDIKGSVTTGPLVYEYPSDLAYVIYNRMLVGRNQSDLGTFDVYQRLRPEPMLPSKVYGKFRIYQVRYSRPTASSSVAAAAASTSSSAAAAAASTSSPAAASATVVARRRPDPSGPTTPVSSRRNARTRRRQIPFPTVLRTSPTQPRPAAQRMPARGRSTPAPTAPTSLPPLPRGMPLPPEYQPVKHGPWTEVYDTEGQVFEYQSDIPPYRILDAPPPDFPNPRKITWAGESAQAARTP